MDDARDATWQERLWPMRACMQHFGWGRATERGRRGRGLRSEWSLRGELEELARRLPGAVVIRDAAEEHFDRFNARFPGWSKVPDAVSYDLRGEPASLDALVAHVWQLHNADEPILLVPDHMTEDILQIRPDDLKAAITALLPLPSGWVIGPADWRWLLELKFIGTAYCGAAPPTSA